MKRTLTPATAMLAALLGGLASLLVLAQAPAEAAFPGENGRIAFSSDRDGDFDIYTMAPDGTDVRKLTSNGRFDGFPAYSPDGRKIAYTGQGKGKRKNNRDIYVMKANGTDVRRLTDDNDNDPDQDPSWSPDGQRIVFVSQRVPSPTGAVKHDIYSMNADGTGVRRLTDDPGEDDSPAFSPDGTQIVFQSTRDSPNPYVYLMNTDGSDEHPLLYDTDFTEHIWQPSWSPEGTTIAFKCELKLCVGAADGSYAHVISDTYPYSHYHPAFSPDGTRIAFVSDRDPGALPYRANPEIYVMDADGSNHSRLTDSPSSVERQPDWRPVPAPRR